MSVIKERLNINAAAAIVAGQLALNTMSQGENPDFAVYNVGVQTLKDTSKKLSDFYAAHPLIGRIVKFFDTHSIGGLFGKKSKIDALIAQLDVFKDKEAEARAAAEVARKEALVRAQEEANAAEAARKAAHKAIIDARIAAYAKAEENAVKRDEAARKQADAGLSPEEMALIAQSDEAIAEAARKAAEEAKNKEARALQDAVNASKREEANKRAQAGAQMDPTLADRLARQASKVTFAEEQQRVTKE